MQYEIKHYLNGIMNYNDMSSAEFAGRFGLDPRDVVNWVTGYTEPSLVMRIKLLHFGIQIANERIQEEINNV